MAGGDVGDDDPQAEPSRWTPPGGGDPTGPSPGTPPAGFSTPPPPPGIPSVPAPAAGWTPPPPAQYVVPAATWRSLSGLTTALTVLLWLLAASGLLGIAAFANRVSVADDLLNGHFVTFKRASDADDLVNAATVITGLLTLAILVLMIIWTFRAMHNNEALGRRNARFTPGWGIAGWLIPFANFVIPVLILQDLWRGADPSVPRGDVNWRQARGSGLIGWYWAALLLSYARFAGGTTNDNLDRQSRLRDIRTRDSVAIGGMVMTMVAAILAIQVVRRIAARQEQCLRAQQAAWGMAPPTTTW